MSGKVYTCCNKVYTKADSYRAHVRRNHQKKPCEDKACPIDQCPNMFYWIKDLRHHMESEHGVQQEILVESFDNIQLFEKWKKELEHGTNERYHKNTGVKTSALFKGVKCSTFDCHRSGYTKRRKFEKLDHSRKKQGSWKLNGICTARMQVYEAETGIVEVIFHKTHTHKTDAKYCNLSDETTAQVAGLLKSGLTTEFILKLFQAKPSEHRDYFLKENDVKKIAIRFALANDGREDPNDMKSVFIFAKNHPEEVIYFRPQTPKPVEPQTPELVQLPTPEPVQLRCSKPVEPKDHKHELVICFQTQRQRDLCKNDFRFLFVDTTHNIGPKLKLATLMTKDEDFEGVALAFCICESESEEIMQVFFSAIRDKLGRKIKTDVFVSDGANAFYNAWIKEMCDGEFPLKRLCAWHVNKNWTGHLNEIRNTDPEVVIDKKVQPRKDKKKTCKDLLFAMRSELNKSLFETKFSEFMTFLDSDDDYSKFSAYFTKTYSKRTTEWAYAYLPSSGGGNTNMCLEAWHRTFKYNYLEGVYKRRLDFVLNKFFEFEQDQKIKAESKQVFGYRSKKTAKVRKSHQLANKTKEKYEVSINPSDEFSEQYIVQGNGMPNVVSKVSDEPLHHEKCNFQCEECLTCIHTSLIREKGKYVKNWIFSHGSTLDMCGRRSPKFFEKILCSFGCRKF